MKLFPTPTTRDYKDGQAERIRDGVIQDDTIARCIFEAIRGGAILMPTPKALDGVKGNLKTSDERLESGHQVDLPNVAIDLLGTPRATAAESSAVQVELGAPKSRLEDQVLLPTPTAVDGNTVAKSELDANDPKHRLKVQAQVLARDGISWGKFEPAIRRWENVLGRPAPAPTKPDGREGAHRLSSEFTEWMMGLPAGWVTGCGLTRNEELKACGNGVVPQQAELALRILLEGISFEPAGGGQVMFPTPTVSDTFTDNLASTQQKPGSMHSVTLPQAVRMVAAVEETN
jgi:DNA (cytosine-5)-methyltransferase 1